VELPRSLQSLLDNARAEAKRHGHSSTELVHLAAALLATDEERFAAGFGSDFRDQLYSHMDGLETSWGTPQDAPETIALLSKAAEHSAPLDEVLAALGQSLKLATSDISDEQKEEPESEGLTSAPATSPVSQGINGSKRKGNYPKYKQVRCTNCFIPGHTHSKCKLPIISLGIMAYKHIDGVLWYLMIRRRHTIHHIEFIRGRYDFDHLEKLNEMFRQMTPLEKNMVCNYSFDEIWDNMWLTTCKSFKKEYQTAKQKFYILREGLLLDEVYIDLKTLSKNNQSYYDYPEWGFPKGRRDMNETNQRCAEREFREETNYVSTDYTIRHDIKPIKESYCGSNGVEYLYIYYTASMDTASPAVLNPVNQHQISEVGNIGWYTYHDAYNLIRPEHKAKRKALTKLHNILTTDQGTPMDTFLNTDTDNNAMNLTF